MKGWRWAGLDIVWPLVGRQVSSQIRVFLFGASEAMRCREIHRGQVDGCNESLAWG